MARKQRIVRVRVDQDFTLAERTAIQRAFDTWEVMSQHRVEFAVTWNVPKPGPYYEYAEPDADQGLFFWAMSRVQPTVPERITHNWGNYVGLMVYGKGENSGNIIVFDEVPPDQFYATALHEVGHLLGMRHSKNGAWSVMEPHARANCVADWDAAQLCQLYGCVPTPGCPEPSFPSPPTAWLAPPEVP